MGYDDRRGTLDPGLTALALRARQNPRGRYPFLEHARRGRSLWLIATGIVAGAVAAWRHRRARRASPASQPPPGRPPASPPVS
jgi:hypothetical protein